MSCTLTGSLQLLSFHPVSSDKWPSLFQLSKSCLGNGQHTPNIYQLVLTTAWRRSRYSAITSLLPYREAGWSLRPYSGLCLNSLLLKHPWLKAPPQLPWVPLLPYGLSKKGPFGHQRNSAFLEQYQRLRLYVKNPCTVSLSGKQSESIS